MKTYIFYKKDQVINLKDCYFTAVRTSREGLLIDTIYAYKPSLIQEWTYSYEELLKLNKSFYVRKKKSSGWDTYKTTKGLMTRLYEDTRLINRKLTLI